MTCNGEYISNNHLGHFAYECLSRHLERVCQIDAATGEEETYGSVLKRSIGLANALRSFGLNPGDVLAVGGCNHLDICIPHFAALFNGLPFIGVDPYYKCDEVRTLFELTRPKIAFCQRESHDVYAKAAADLELDIKLVTFNEGVCTMTKFIEMYNKNSESEQDFKVANYDLDKIYPFLICTSGTTGKCKIAAFKNKSLLTKFARVATTQIKEPNRKTLVLSPVNWLSFCFAPMNAAITGGTRLQTSNPEDFDHVIDVINRYKPQMTLFSPTLIAYMLKRQSEVDLTCFKSITITGSKIYQDVLTDFKKLLSKSCIFVEAYGQTEMMGPVLAPSPLGPVGSCGKPTNMYHIKLVDPDTGVEIKEANINGELLVKGPGFSMYYNDPETTASSFTDNGFFKTGDLLYRDNENNYHYVDRIKSFIKYRNSHVYPTELEELISRLPGVKAVGVIGVDDPVDGQRPAACVVRSEGSTVTAQEIKDLVASNLSKNKELRGGVLFLDSLPLTSTGKILKGKLKEIAMKANRE